MDLYCATADNQSNYCSILKKRKSSHKTNATVKLKRNPHRDEPLDKVVDDRFSSPQENPNIQKQKSSMCLICRARSEAFTFKCCDPMAMIKVYHHQSEDSKQENDIKSSENCTNCVVNGNSTISSVSSVTSSSIAAIADSTWNLLDFANREGQLMPNMTSRMGSHRLSSSDHQKTYLSSHQQQSASIPPTETSLFSSSSSSSLSSNTETVTMATTCPVYLSSPSTSSSAPTEISSLPSSSVVSPSLEYTAKALTQCSPSKTNALPSCNNRTYTNSKNSRVCDASKSTNLLSVSGKSCAKSSVQNAFKTNLNILRTFSLIAVFIEICVIAKCKTRQMKFTRQKTETNSHFWPPKYPIAFIVLSLMTFLLPMAHSAEIRLQRNETVCKSRDIRNTPSEFHQLANCTVIEGFLLITLIDFNRPSQNIKYDELSFPMLTEVTEFVVIYRVNGLPTLGTLFPNLSVIRGKELFEGFALVIYENTHLEDVGLRSLTTITRGAVRIEKNPMLCFVKTIDWGQIAVNMSSEHHFFLDNKKEGECPQCPGGSGKSEDKKVSITCPMHQGRRYCWNSKFCQKICPSSCKTNCNDELKCCNDACIGGCSTTNLSSCTSCRHFAKSDVCMDKCPPDYFSYLERRCVTADTCTKVIGTKLEGTKQEYLVPFDGVCSVRCPPGHSKVKATCVKCVGKCIKTCGGAVIDSVGAAKQFHGCTHIVGSPLNISIKRGGRHLMEELELGLSSIEEIDTFLKVHRTYGMVSLAFFKNLKRIKGLTLESGKFALYVLENQDLENIWGPNQVVEIERGRVFFHFNPKLCFSVIDELRASMKDGAKFDKNEVAEDSNGSKGSCNTEVLNVKVVATSSLTALVRITNPMKFEDDRVFIGYQYFYTEDPYKNVSMFGHRPCEERWSSDDPTKDNQHVFSNLKPYTQYAFYVKTHTISSERRNGQSPIMYFRTKPDQPKSVQNLKAISNSSSEVIVRWNPPTITNGNLIQYILTAKLDEDSDSKLKTRNFCNDPLVLKETSSEVNVIPTIEKNNNQACQCEKNETRNSSPNLLEEAVYENLIDFENNLQNFIYVKKQNNSEIYQRRRRRAVDFYGAIQDKVTTVIPSSSPSLSPSNTTDVDSLITGKDFIIDSKGKFYKYITVSVNASVLEYVFTKFKHFALYTITIRACREYEEGAPGKNCSPESLSFARTHKLDDVDIVRNLQVELEQSNTTRSNLRIKWEPPERPNGLTTSYTIFYTDVNSMDAVHEKRCITEQDYQKNFQERGYPLKGLPTGNYSIQVRANSFAGEGIKSEPVFKYIPPNRITWQTITFICIGLLVFFIIVAYVIYLVRKKFLAPPSELKIFPTVNPYYISMQYLPDEWEVPRDKIIQLGALGQGSFGMVYEGILKNFNNQEDTPCAIKTVNENATDRERLNFLKEASVMKQFNTHHVVRLLGVCSRGQPALVIMELMKYGDLKAFLRQHRPDAEASIHGEPPFPPPSLERILQIAIEIADGMAYLAAKKFVHRDLAARNCMVAADLTVKIGDFGMTRDIYETDYYRKGTKGLLPVRWMAPESLKDGVFSSASDVFSYGVVLWEMATLASQPYQGFSNDQVLRFVIDGGVMERPDTCPDKLYKLMQKCWQHRPGARPTFMEIIRFLLDTADPKFQEVSFYHSAEAREMLDQMHPEHDLDDATTPLRAGEYDYKLNIEYNSSVELHDSPALGDEDDEDDDDNDAPHSPYSLVSAMIISSTPHTQGKHSPNVIMNQSNPTLSLPSTSAAAIAASAVAPTTETLNLENQEDPAYEFNTENQPAPHNSGSTVNAIHNPSSIISKKPIKNHSSSPSSNKSKNAGSLKRAVASTVQNVSSNLRMPNFLQRRLFKNNNNLQSSGGNRGKRYSDTKSEASNNGIKNNSNEGSMASNIEAGTTGLRPFFTGLTPSHTSKNPNYQILDESMNISANREIQSPPDEQVLRKRSSLAGEEQQLVSSDDREDNRKGTSNSDSQEQCNPTKNYRIIKDNKPSQISNQTQLNEPSTTRFLSPEATSPSSVKKSRKTSEEVALIPTPTSCQLKENWLKQLPQPPPNGFIGREG